MTIASRVRAGLRGEFWFPGDEILRYYRDLPGGNAFENISARIRKPIVVITHDDILDRETLEFELGIGVRSTFFLLARRLKKDENLNCLKDGFDLEMHFDKREGPLERQIERFTRIVGKKPTLNRNHSLLWRADHLDLAYLSTRGMLADSTKIGLQPYRLCVEGRHLPIWEVPFAVYDSSVEKAVHCGYKICRHPETLFSAGATPIVALYHPISLARQWRLDSDYEKFCNLALEYNYEFKTMRELLHDCLESAW